MWIQTKQPELLFYLFPQTDPFEKQVDGLWFLLTSEN